MYTSCTVFYKPSISFNVFTYILEILFHGNMKIGKLHFPAGKMHIRDFYSF